ncbi:hypothetical protein BH18ACT15_BH18ACT15_06280 [soil metagenome]
MVNVRKERMARVRVHEVAKQLGLPSKDVVAHLASIGEPVKSHSSSIDEGLAARVRSDLGGDGAGVAAVGRETPSEVPEAVQPTPTPQPEPEPSPQPEPEPAASAPLKVHRGVTVGDFAARAGVAPTEVVKKLIGLGEMVTVTQSMSDEALLLVAEDLGVAVQIVEPGGDEEEPPEEEAADEEQEGAEIVSRPPVVTVMGHVDHGKTAILDAIRATDVAGGEAGGITQHIGAYRVHHGGREITFIDTPGHAAFTAMRARGAQVTDIAVLVVAADDGVMPQTLEALDHAAAAGVPVIVAVNKIDRPDADTTRVRQQLTERELVPEEWGGDTIFVDVSAREKTNLDQLLEMILLTTDVQVDLKTDAAAFGRGVVIEANLDKGRGPVATVLVKRGSLYQGDALVAGAAWGRVRAMLDERGRQVERATPGQPVQVLGWQGLPDAGDEVRALADEREARDVASERSRHRRAAELVGQGSGSLQTLLAATREGEVPELNLLVKADAHGSVEALDGQLKKLDQSDVKLNVLRKGVGGITENDVTLAQASDAVVIGFNVVPDAGATGAAAKSGVDVRTYRVIYQAIEDIERAAKGMLGPEVREVAIGQAEVRATFRVPRAGTVAGCMVLDGVIRRNARARLVRDGAVIYESTIASLKRFKDDQREVVAGFECGIGIEGFNDIKEGDIIQAFEVQEVAR